MKSYVLLIIFSFLLLVVAEVDAYNLPVKCECFYFSMNSCIYKTYKDRSFYWCTTKDRNSLMYPYTLISDALWDSLIKEPIFYYEYRHNMNITNETLNLYLECKTKELENWIRQYKCPPMQKPFSFEEIRKNYDTGIAKNQKIDQRLREEFRYLYKFCYKSHHHNPQTYFDNGFLEYIEGNVVEAAELTEKYLNACKESDCVAEIAPSHLVTLGQSYMELSQYQRAIEAFSEAIRKDPVNKEAHFYRSQAFFETGKFEKAMQDYLASKNEQTISDHLDHVPTEFTGALILAIGKGATEATIDFVPSMCNSIYGLGETLWAQTVKQWTRIPLVDDIKEIKQFSKACYDLSDSFVDYCKRIDENTLLNCSEQLKGLYNRYDQLSPAEKGELIGYSLGRYGTDICAGGAAVKLIAAARNLKKANAVLNMEAMALDNKALKSSALKHNLERERYFQNVKIQIDKQNKHVVGKHNYDPRKSTLTHNDPDQLLKKYAGTGQKVRGNPGECGYQEIVNFEEQIGFHVDGVTGENIGTSWGKIHYAQDGAHIVPTTPRK